MSKGLRLGESTTTTSGDRSGCKPDPLLLQAPNLGKPRARDSPGTGRGFQAPPKVRAASRAGNPARAPKRGAAAGKSGEKNFCFFFFFFSLFWHSRSPGALLLAPRGATPPRAPRPFRTASQSPFVGSPVGGADGGKGFKRRRRARREQIADAEDPSPGFAKPWIIPAETSQFSPVFCGADFAVFRTLGLRRKVWGSPASEFAFPPSGLAWAVFHCGL